MTSTFFSSSMPPLLLGPSPPAGGGGRGARETSVLQAEPLRLAGHLVLRDLHELAALDLVDGRLRGRPVVGRRVRHRVGEAADVEVLQRLERLLDALAVELSCLVGAAERL